MSQVTMESEMEGRKLGLLVELLPNNRRFERKLLFSLAGYWKPILHTGVLCTALIQGEVLILTAT